MDVGPRLGLRGLSIKLTSGNRCLCVGQWVAVRVCRRLLLWMVSSCGGVLWRLYLPSVSLQRLLNSSLEPTATQLLSLNLHTLSTSPPGLARVLCRAHKRQTQAIRLLALGTFKNLIRRRERSRRLVKLFAIGLVMRAMRYKKRYRVASKVRCDGYAAYGS